MNQRFISLGPTCVAAEILRISDLRLVTYGFDWVRSGSIHLSQLMSYDINSFIETHVVVPNIRLTQIADPANSSVNTAELNKLSLVYGYEYFYAPHRKLLSANTISYHARTLSRIKDVICKSVLRKCFVLADYLNKDGAITLQQVEQSCSFVRGILDSYSCVKHDLVAIRITLLSENKFYFDVKNMNGFSLLSVGFPRRLDEPIYRDKVYSLIGKKLLTLSTFSG